MNKIFAGKIGISHPETGMCENFTPSRTTPKGELIHWKSMVILDAGGHV
jgi:hypothetical protein